MTYFKEHPSSLRMRVLLGLAALGVAALIAGCGSSGSSSTITIGNESKADEKLASAGSPPAVSTPTSGPLATKPTVTVPTGPPPTTLQTKDLIVGTGAEAKAGDSLTVNYVGVLYNGGTEFDSSWKRNEPFAFTLGKGQVIPAWDQGLVGMKVGGRRELIVPASLAYGAKGAPPKIPPNAALVFVVDLLGV